MEEKTDKVVGYIEYLGAGGIIGEIVPYTSVEKFKDEILDSLDCGRPVTPVVFSDELDEPLQFDSDTYFPWGFRSEKRVQIPYEIYQTNRRDLVFMEYSPARLAAGAKDYELVYKGQMERWETLDSIYSRHNRDDRPNAKSMRCPAQRHVHNRAGKSHRRQQLTVGQAGRTAAAIYTAYHPKLSVYGRAAVRRGYCAAGPVCP